MTPSASLVCGDVFDVLGKLDPMITVIDHAVAEEWLPGIETGSVNLLILDPPYFKVATEDWDHQWKSPAGYLAWLAGLADEWRRILAPNGSLYLFASAAMAARVEVEVIAPRLEVLNSITWAKGHADLAPGDPRLTPYKAVDTASARAFNSESERVIFAEQRGTDSMALGEAGYAAQCETLRGFLFEPLRAYLDGERRAAGFSISQVRDGLGFSGNMPFHWFAVGQAEGKASQWAMPTAEHYAAMQLLFNGHLRREYEELRREYEKLRQRFEVERQRFADLRRPFAVSSDVPHTDVWTYPTVEPGPGRHSCEKPLEMISDIIRASSREGDLVADCFAGSGTAFAASIDTGREFTGCEADIDWVRRGNDRGERHRSIKERRPVASRKPAGTVTGPLFDCDNPPC